jgi:hypothetical protein
MIGLVGVTSSPVSVCGCGVLSGVELLPSTTPASPGCFDDGPQAATNNASNNIRTRG